MARRPALRTGRSFQPRGGPGTHKDAHLAGTWAQEDPAGGSWTPGPGSGGGGNWPFVSTGPPAGAKTQPWAQEALTPSTHPGLRPLPPTPSLWFAGGTQRTAVPERFPIQGPLSLHILLSVQLSLNQSGVTPPRLSPQARALSCLPWGTPGRSQPGTPAAPWRGPWAGKPAADSKRPRVLY